MTGRAKARGRTKSRRAAFTMIEILVVIGIMLVLMSLLLGAVSKVMDARRASNSNETLRKVSRELDRQWHAAVDDIRDAIRSGGIPSGVIAMSQDQYGNVDMERAAVIWLKLRLTLEFPVCFAQANPPPNFWYSETAQQLVSLPAPGSPYYFVPPTRSQYQQLPSGSNPPAANESAACLLAALSVGRRGVQMNPEDLGNVVVGSPGPKYIVDGWDTPIGFFRWPVGNSEVGKLDPIPGAMFPDSTHATDPLDPTGRLMDPKWNNPTTFGNQQGAYWFEQLCHPIHDPTNPNWAVSYYLIPVVGSAGPNHQFGFEPALFGPTANPFFMSVPPGNSQAMTAADDNIYSYRP